MTKDKEPTEDLIECGILERNSVNETLPTASFLIWLYEQKGMALVDWEDYENTTTDKEWEGHLKTEVRNAIVTWNMQVIDGKSYSKLDIDQHVKTISAIIKEILDERMKIHLKKITNRVIEK
jgi:hypothetical protein